MNKDKNNEIHIKERLKDSYWVQSGLYKKSLGYTGGVSRLVTGIPGLDEALGGGLPECRSTLISGSTGSGKTILLSAFLYYGIIKYDEAGVFVTFEEPPEEISKDVRNFGWDFTALIQKQKLAFVNASPIMETSTELTPDYDFTPLIERIKHAVKKVKAKRLVIDSIGALFLRFSNKDAIRNIFFNILTTLKQSGVTILISNEKTGKGISRYGMQEYVVDGVIDIAFAKAQQKFIRQMNILKMRGVDFSNSLIEFEITNKGPQIYPKIPVENTITKTSLKNREKFGIQKFDELINGGIPEGHIVLLSGNTGTGKTTFALKFILEGLKKGDNAVYVGMEESRYQVFNHALSHDWDLEKYEKKGSLIYSENNLIDISPDKLLYKIINSVMQTKAKRVVLDSISSILSTTMNELQVKQFLYQLTEFLKSQGVTCILNYLNASNFGAEKKQMLAGIQTNHMYLSSIVDGVILLLFVEKNQTVRKLLNILKMRGSRHSKKIYQYEIKKGSITIEDVFKK